MNPAPYTLHNGTICVVGSAVIGTVVSKPMWDKLGREIGLVQRGGNGRSSLIAFDRIPAKHRTRIEEAFGSPQKEQAKSGLMARLKPDAAAAAYFSRPDASGKGLDLPKQAQYTANAIVLNALAEAMETETRARATHGKTIGDFWKRASEAVNALPKDIKHKLPANERALRRKAMEYMAARKQSPEAAYALLVHGGHGQQNALKVTHTLEQLIVSIAVMPQRPFTSTVHEYLMLFLTGVIGVYDSDGVMYDPAQFTKPDGTPITVSEATVWNYVKKNETIIAALTMGGHRFSGTHRPYHHRHAPEYAFSKISMDDRDLPRKMEDGKRVKAYYAYDVASGAVIGRSYSRTKDETLFIDCLRDMLRFIDAGEWGGIPHEVEVEHHLVSNFKAKLEEVFPLVRWCRPGNSQEKRAEHFNRSKKVTVEKRNHRDIGRWWARYSRYQVDEDKVNDEFTGRRYRYDQLVADDMEDVEQYNAQLHPNQKKYPGMSRMDVLVAYMSPSLLPLSRPAMVRMIGNCTATSINRLELKCNRSTYRLPNGMDDLNQLRPGDLHVQAYWLPDAAGNVTEVHVYQRDRYLFTCPQVVTHSEARAEWTESDESAFHTQAAYVGHFDAQVKAKKKEVQKVGILREARQVANVPAPIILPEPTRETLPQAPTQRRSLKDRF